MKTIIEKIKTLDKGTIIRSSLLILSFINEIIALIGATSYASATWYQIISLIFTIIVSSICAWKNNDFTKVAQLAGQVLKALKDKKLEEDEVKNLLSHADKELKENNNQN